MVEHKILAQLFETKGLLDLIDMLHKIDDVNYRKLIACIRTADRHLLVPRLTLNHEKAMDVVYGIVYSPEYLKKIKALGLFMEEIYRSRFTKCKYIDSKHLMAKWTY